MAIVAGAGSAPAALRCADGDDRFGGLGRHGGRDLSDREAPPPA